MFVCARACVHMCVCVCVCVCVCMCVSSTLTLPLLPVSIPVLLNNAPGHESQDPKPGGKNKDEKKKRTRSKY